MLLVLVAGLVLIVSALPALERWVVISPDATLEELERVAKRVERLAWVVGVIQVLLLGCLSWWAMKTGSAVLASGQIPPPGAWTAVRTRVRRGRVATYAGWACRVLAVLIWVPGILSLAFIHSFFDVPR